MCSRRVRWALLLQQGLLADMLCCIPYPAAYHLFRLQYADEEKMAFKKPTRLECMMQV